MQPTILGLPILPSTVDIIHMDMYDKAVLHHAGKYYFMQILSCFYLSLNMFSVVRV